MKLTIFLGGLSGGGTERVVCNLANYLVSAGYEIDIITMADDDPAYFLSSSVNRIELLKTKERKNFIYNSFLRIKRLRKYMKTSDTEEYLVMLPTTIILLLSFHKLTHAPIVVSERGDPSKLSKTNQLLLRQVVKNASGFVFQTQDVQEWYTPYIEGIYSEVIPNAINEEFLNDNVSEKSIERKIVGVGRFTEQKNFELLIKAFEMVHKRYPEYKLVLFGDGPKRDVLINLVKSLNLEDCVELPGYVQNIKDEIRTSSLFVLSSNYEGIPNSLIEAMAIGIPCVATDCPVGGPKYLNSIGERNNCLLIPMNDLESMTDAMCKLISDPNLAKQLSINAQCVKSELHPNIIYRKWDSFLRCVKTNNDK